MALDLKTIPLFEGVPPGELGELAARAALRDCAEGETVVREGEPADALFVVVSGRLKVCLHDEAGGELMLDVKGPGEYFGEMMLDDSPRSASVVALEPSHLAIIPRADFESLLLRHPRAALEVIRNLTRITRRLNDRAREGEIARARLRKYAEELGARDVAALPKVRRWRLAKRWVLIALLALAAIQYYFLDVMSQIERLPRITLFSG